MTSSPAVALRTCAVALALCMVAGCATLPSQVARTPSTAITDTAGTHLGRVFAPGEAAHPGLTAVLAMPSGREAFASRLALARKAERSLDVQYYIWHADTSGGLLANELWNAAERGVRVRILLDDLNTKGEDPALAVLDAHPNIEVRLFNPFANRSFRAGDYAGDFSRINRRMHNKSFTADNQVSVVGGRNIGDEYLGADSPVAFADLDVLIAGAVVDDVSREFDAYWNSAAAWPVPALLPPPTPETRAQVRNDWQAKRDSPTAAQYLAALHADAEITRMLDGRLPLDWVRARVIADNPDKVLHPPDREDLHMLPQLLAAMGPPIRELDLVSPYFVPGKEGTAALVALAQRGVHVSVLTNSLAATDVAPVYAGYAKYRSELLRGGVHLWELKPGAEPPPGPDTSRASSGSGFGGSGSGGSSTASLHAKTFGVDGERIFVGSFNLDPRSARLNTEMGVVLDSPALAARLARAFETAVPLRAYEVRLAANGQDVEWLERTEQGEKRIERTPETGTLRKMWIGILSILPIEWLL